ncbi:MAG TPA: GNAT family N-acetyltransferase [Methylophilaceae bacterium]|jgi:predicted N-acyltransferase
MQQIAMSAAPSQASLYTTEHSFSAAKYEEATWDRLLPGDAESYRYHLAFDLSKVEGFKTGYAAVRRGGIVVCLAPYFITDYRLDSTIQGPIKRFTSWVNGIAPGLLSLRLLCVGSPVTDSGKIGITHDYPFDPEIITALHQELEQIAKREDASVIAFKDILESDTGRFAEPLIQAGFSRVGNMPVGINRVDYASLDEYLETLSYATRKNLRRKRKVLPQMQIEEHDGMPPDLDAIYQLYLSCYERSELKFEKLTKQFFESVATLMPDNCRFVLYRAEGKLIGFNLLLHRNGVLLDKYIGLDHLLGRKYNLYFLSWLHNIEMSIRDGFHIFQSGQAAYEMKIKLGSELQQTYVFFRHRNPVFNPLLKLASKFLAYANFDSAISKEKSNSPAASAL